MNTRRIFYTVCLLVLSSTALAQPGGERPKKQKIEELKIAFITNELDLTSEEAQKFWPIYNELDDKLHAENRKQRDIHHDLESNAASYSEADFKSKSETMLASSIREAELIKEYHSKIAGAIGYKKATKLLSLEREFKRELLNRLNNQEGGPGQHRPGPPPPR